MGGLYGALPAASAESLSKPLTEVLKAQHGGALSIGAVLALWSASNGVGTVMKAFNRAYGVEETRSFVVKKGLAVGMTVVLSLLLISGFVLLAFGGQIGEMVASGLGLGGLFTVTWNVVRVIGALMAQGSDPFTAAVTGVYVHAESGRRVQDRIGESGLLASDLLPELPVVMQALREGRG